MPLNNYNFRKGVDVPQWEWMAQMPVGNFNSGGGIASDGVRYIYKLVQIGTTATTASTTVLYRFDTWNNGWQFLATVTSGNAGMDIDYDAVRNVVWIVNGASLTSWQFFNLNLTSRTYFGATAGGFALSAACAPVLPAAAAAGSSILLPNDVELPSEFDAGVVLAGSTSTTLIDDTADPGFSSMLVGCYLEYTSGTLLGQRRVISSVTNSTTLVTAAFTGAPVAGDTFKIVLPQETATSGTATTIVKTGAGWINNKYSFSDVEIIGGTGVGQRRRIASNDATTLTLAAAVAGNPRTGPWSITPDATSVFVIKTSSDFLYYQPGGTTGLQRIDIMATTPVWSALAVAPGASGAGADLKHPKAMSPSVLLQIRGANTNNIYNYDIGLNSWASITHFPGPELVTTGATTIHIPGRRRIITFIAGNLRVAVANFATGAWDTAPMLPYAAPSAVDGKRSMYIKTPDGVEWIYFFRAGGSEVFRLPLDWL